jgi:hypothetical protein
MIEARIAKAIMLSPRAIFGGFVPLVLTWFTSHYGLGFAIPMLIATTRRRPRRPVRSGEHQPALSVGDPDGPLRQRRGDRQHPLLFLCSDLASAITGAQ